MKIVSKLFRFLFFLALMVSLFLSTVGRALIDWYNSTFGVTIAEILFTIKSPLKGADASFLVDAIYAIVFPTILLVILILIILLLLSIQKKVSIIIHVGNMVNFSCIAIVLALFFFVSLFNAKIVITDLDESLKVSEYLRSRMSETHIYEEYYVKPDVDNITSDNPKNLIYIYMESMETTYASVEDGGYQPEINYIPNLTEMASDNISFSNDNLLGGFISTPGTGWTASALFATSSGIPFSFPIQGNEDFGNRVSFASGTITLGDILHEKGYYQEFLCGSDATFGGRKAFYEQHGEYNVFDFNTALKIGYVDEGNGWWGFDDRDLYKIAKDELTRIAALDQPFNLTMLTVDTHHVDGWICDLCDDEYPDRLANVVKCADNQICDFIEWCQEQSWYDNTVIVIQGDHPRMDTSLVEGVAYNDRTAFNCFINTDYSKGKLNLYNRQFTPMDMYPTVLAAIGFDIPYDRLGLGTNMFSDRTTIVEDLGLDYIIGETWKYSQYYLNNFS